MLPPPLPDHFKTKWKFLCRPAKLCLVCLLLKMESLFSRLRSVLPILLIISMLTMSWLLQVAASRYVNSFLPLALYLHILSPYHRAESYTLHILLTCRAIQLLHNSVIPLSHQCPACSHLKSQTSGWLISLGYASTEAVSIPMFRITLSSNKIVVICKLCSQITCLVSIIYVLNMIKHQDLCFTEGSLIVQLVFVSNRSPE